MSNYVVATEHTSHHITDRTRDLVTVSIKCRDGALNRHKVRT